MAFHRTVLLLALGSFLPHTLHTHAPTAAQHLSSLEQRLSQQFSGAQLPVNAATMVKQLHKPLSFFFDLGQQYPTIIPAFDAFLNRLITLTYTRGNAKELSHQREVALTSFVTILARIFPEHTANPRVRRVAYQQVREVYNYYANRALTRSVQRGDAPAHVMSREEKVLRWIKTGAIIMAAATAATLIGTAIYQVAKTPAAVAPAPLSRGPQTGPHNSSPAPAPAPAPPLSDGLGSGDASSLLRATSHGHELTSQPPSAASTMTPPSQPQQTTAESNTPATDNVRRNLGTALAALDHPYTHSAPAPSPALNPSPEPVVSEWTAPEGCTDKYTAQDVLNYLTEPTQLRDDQTFLALKLDLAPISEYAMKLLTAAQPDANFAAKLYVIAAHRQLAKQVGATKSSDGNLVKMAKIFQNSRGNGGGGKQRVVTLTKQGQDAAGELSLSEIKAQIGTQLWQKIGEQGVKELIAEHRRNLIAISKKLFNSHTTTEAKAFRSAFDPLQKRYS